jgi:hypothetical protein
MSKIKSGPLPKPKASHPTALVRTTLSRNYPFRVWCSFKGFSYVTGYALLEKDLIETFLIGSRRFVSEEADRKFDQRTRGGT